MNIRAQDTRDLPHLRRIYLESRRASSDWMDISKFDLADFDHDTLASWCSWQKTMAASKVSPQVGFPRDSSTTYMAED